MFFVSISSKNNDVTKKFCTRRILFSSSVSRFENNGLLQELTIFSTEEPNVELALTFLLLPL